MGWEINNNGSIINQQNGKREVSEKESEKSEKMTERRREMVNGRKRHKILERGKGMQAVNSCIQIVVCRGVLTMIHSK